MNDSLNAFITDGTQATGGGGDKYDFKTTEDIIDTGPFGPCDICDLDQKMQNLRVGMRVQARRNRHANAQRYGRRG